MRIKKRQEVKKGTDPSDADADPADRRLQLLEKLILEVASFVGFDVEIWGSKQDKDLMHALLQIQMASSKVKDNCCTRSDKASKRRSLRTATKRRSEAKQGLKKTQVEKKRSKKEALITTDLNTNVEDGEEPTMDDSVKKEDYESDASFGENPEPSSFEDYVAENMDVTRRELKRSVKRKNDDDEDHDEATMFTHPCGNCSEVFERKKDLLSHIFLAHKGETVKKLPAFRKCQFCSKTFTHKGKFEIHTRTHTNERPYLCYICGYSAKSTQMLNSHVKLKHPVETRRKDLQCDKCDHTFFSKHGMMKHMRKVHSETGTNALAADCTICGTVLADKSKLKRHIEDVHENRRTLACHICGQLFKRPAHLQQHVIRHSNPSRRKRGPQPPKTKATNQTTTTSTEEGNEAPETHSPVTPEGEEEEGEESPGNEKSTTGGEVAVFENNVLANDGNYMKEYHMEFI